MFKTKITLLLPIVLFMLVIPQKVSACCDCAIVNASMMILKATYKAGIEAMDEELGEMFTVSVKNEADKSKEATDRSIDDIEKSIKLFPATYSVYDRIKFDTQKKCYELGD